jgi:predicted nuclease of predicted toxin-antitoxin system
VTVKEQALTVLLDEGTPVLAATPFLDRGHRVIYHSDVLESGARDEVVAATAMINQAALIAVDLDMKRLVRRFGAPDASGHYRSLDLISISCNETLAAKRLDQALSFIEHEWRISRAKKARRLWIDVGPHRLTTYR